jgi:hypothetical protein
VIEIHGDLFKQANYDALVVTTNGSRKKNGYAVMDKGVALTAKKKWRGLDKALGRQLYLYGNICRIIFSHKLETPTPIIAFPVKHTWDRPADIQLIRRSLNELKIIADNNPHWTKIVLPRPGCGNGRLSWQKDGIDGLCARVLDNRFIVVNNEPELEENVE